MTENDKCGLEYASTMTSIPVQYGWFCKKCGRGTGTATLDKPECLVDRLQKAAENMAALLREEATEEDEHNAKVNAYMVRMMKDELWLMECRMADYRSVNDTLRLIAIGALICAAASGFGLVMSLVNS